MPLAFDNSNLLRSYLHNGLRFCSTFARVRAVLLNEVVTIDILTFYKKNI